MEEKSRDIWKRRVETSNQEDTYQRENIKEYRQDVVGSVAPPSFLELHYVCLYFYAYIDKL